MIDEPYNPLGFMSSLRLRAWGCLSRDDGRGTRGCLCGSSEGHSGESEIKIDEVLRTARSLCSKLNAARGWMASRIKKFPGPRIHL